MYVPIGLEIIGRDGILAPVAPNRTIGASNMVVAKGFILTTPGAWTIVPRGSFHMGIPPDVVNGVLRIPIDLRGDIVFI